MRALVTGGTGFVGSALVRALLKNGFSVRVLARENSNLQHVNNLEGVEIFYGDLLQPRSLRPAVSGCEALFHVAADYRLWVPDPDRMHAVNVIGTRELMRTALTEGVKKIVYTSSVATLKIDPYGTPVDEKSTGDLSNIIGHYKRAKFLAEREVVFLVERENLPAVIVNPSTPIGPRDSKPTPTGRIVWDMLKKRMPAYTKTGLNIAHVDDIARGHILAYQKGHIGERYILGGENLQLIELLRMISEYADVPCPRLCIPHFMLTPMALAAEGWSFFSKREPPLTRDSIKMAKSEMFFSSKKAEQELGYQSRSAREAVADAVEWYRTYMSCI